MSCTCDRYGEPRSFGDLLSSVGYELEHELQPTLDPVVTGDWIELHRLESTRGLSEAVRRQYLDWQRVRSKAMLRNWERGS